jgi:protein tyrosine phosphatase (PTP) superfamily phosphohydrolase (DUF442 family)
MKPIVFRLLFALALPLVVVAGCNHCNPRAQSPCAAQAPVVVPGPGGGPAPVPPGAPMPRGPLTDPPPPAPPGGPIQSKSPDFSQDLTWKPGNGPTVRLYPPEVDESADNTKKTPAKAPEVFENDKPAPRVDFGKPEVPVVDKPAAPKVEAKKTNPFPVGISQFGQVSDNFAGGLRPSLDDGLDWLRDSGYKVVIYLRAPGEPDAADRKQVERRGMRFFSLEVSPETLNKNTVDDFSALVSAQNNQPLFVYDSDGARAGTLWYLHFRLGQKATAEEARRQARVLGLREDREGTHREMWNAAQKFTAD